MALIRNDLEKVARLARLSLSEAERERLGNDLGRIIDFVTKLNEVDVTDVEPMCHAGDRALIFRNDQAEEVLGRDCFSSSMGYEDGLIRVPKIIG